MNSEQQELIDRMTEYTDRVMTEYLLQAYGLTHADLPILLQFDDKQPRPPRPRAAEKTGKTKRQRAKNRRARKARRKGRK